MTRRRTGRLNDAANLLKPARPRSCGRSRNHVVGIQEVLEKDAAPPAASRWSGRRAPDQAIVMMALRRSSEEHHQVRILDEAVEQAVRLSDRYLNGRQLPDKAVSVRDTACARLAIGQNAVPAALEDARRRLTSLDLETGTLEREQVTSPTHAERLGELQSARELTLKELGELEARWEREKTLIQKIRDLRDKLEAHAATPPPAETDVEALRAELAALNRELAMFRARARCCRLSSMHRPSARSLPAGPASPSVR